MYDERWRAVAGARHGRVADGYDGHLLQGSNKVDLGQERWESPGKSNWVRKSAEVGRTNETPTTDSIEDELKDIPSVVKQPTFTLPETNNVSIRGVILSL